MGDYTNGQITVYRCPQEDLEVVLGFIDEHDLGLDYMTASDWTNELHLGAVYGGEVSVGLLFNTDLASMAPGTTYQIWLDPKYEYIGDLEIHVPDLGIYRGECDSSGVSLVSHDVVTQIRLELGPCATADELVTALGQRLGVPWLDAIAALGPVEEVVVRPDTD